MQQYFSAQDSEYCVKYTYIEYAMGVGLKQGEMQESCIPSGRGVDTPW